jgi:hypothetical protein
VHAAFGTVVVVVSLIAIVLALIALARSNRTWSDYGKSGLIMDRDLPSDAAAGSPVAAQERDEEIRAMLEARNQRRARRGEPELDVEEEMARLAGETAPPSPDIDPELREEIRQLVEARNHRRVRAGKEPLDVEAEVKREIARHARGPG